MGSAKELNTIPEVRNNANWVFGFVSEPGDKRFASIIAQKTFAEKPITDQPLTVKNTKDYLYPRESETREVRSLDGLWSFVKSEIENPEQGFRELWYKQELHKIIRHEIGHLPFEVEATSFIKFGSENRVTIMCDNRLLVTTVPQGELVQQPSDKGNRTVQTYTFDFYNYAGIHRSVHLYTAPLIYIEDVKIITDLLTENRGIIKYEILIGGLEDESNDALLPDTDSLFAALWEYSDFVASPK
ncbi:hypothetical protein GQX74_015700 [Glossina fuscipes]|nr:hypothetical protein GQX74_015700 [Glossina fuscipes]